MAKSTDIMVNSYVNGDQDSATITVLSDGGWIVTWDGAGQGDTAGIFQQRYAADGTAQGTASLVNTYTTGGQAHSATTHLADGGWLVSWVGAGNGDGTGIYQQRYNENGATVDGPVLVNTVTTATEQWPAVTGLADGGWVTAWYAFTPGSDDVLLYQQRYSSAGAAIGSQTPVVTTTTAEHVYPSITALATGGWVVSWEDMTFGAGGGSRISQQIFDKNGHELTSQTPFASITDDLQGPHIAALADGGWLVTATVVSENSGLTSTIVQQRYDKNGAAVGHEDVVNKTLSGDRFGGYIAALSDGGWVVVWNGEGKQDNTGVYMRRFDANGAAVTAEILVNSDTSISQTQIVDDVVALPDGGWVVVWSSGTTSNEEDVFQKRYDSDGNVVEASSLPTAKNKTVNLVEDHSYAFSKAAFGYADADGDALEHITLASLPKDGALKLNGKTVHMGDHVDAGALAKLKFVPDDDQIGRASFEFTVTDDSGATSDRAYTFTIKIKDVVDTFAGTGKADKLIGTDGRDILDGKGGNDTLTGGVAADKFVFKTGYDKDAITDFVAAGAGHDLIDLRSVKSIADYADLKAHHMSASHGNVVIDAGHGDVLTLRHTGISSLSEADFLF